MGCSNKLSCLAQSTRSIIYLQEKVVLNDDVLRLHSFYRSKHIAMELNRHVRKLLINRVSIQRRKKKYVFNLVIVEKGSFSEKECEVQ
jgi:hypothetical protein